MRGGDVGQRQAAMLEDSRGSEDEVGLDHDLGEEVGCPLVVVMLGEDRHPEWLGEALVIRSMCD